MTPDQTGWAVILFGTEQAALKVASTVPEGVMVVIRESEAGTHAVVATAEGEEVLSALHAWAAGLDSKDVYLGVGGVSERP